MRRFGIALGLVAIALCSWKLGAVGAQEDASKPEYYTTKVKPILDDHCGRCHEGTSHKGGLNFATREGLLKGGRDGVVVVVGDPEHSLLVKLIRHEGPKDDPMPMPPQGNKLSDEDIAVVSQWIKAGAVMPSATPAGN